jgi:DNA-binding CsgD family transcriptional regulator/PAS domain-containing protein
MVSAEALSRLLYTLYAAPTSPELWPKFLQEFVHLMGVSGGGIVQHDMEQQKFGLSTFVGLDPAGVALYEKYYGTIDEWRAAALRKLEGEAVFGHELCSRAELEKTEFYNDFLVKFDSRLYWTMATERGTTRLESISLYQSWKNQSPDPDNLDLLQFVIPHIQAALRTRRQIVAAETANRELEEALNCLEQGVVLLDQFGNCLFTNIAAQQILNRREGLSIIKSKIWVNSPTERGRLNALIERSCTNDVISSPGGAVAISRDGKRPLNISFHRFRCENPTAPRRAVAIAFISDPESRVRTPPSLMTALFGFTQAECRLAGLLINGCSLKDAAEQCRVTYETVRSQLKSIFNKTGVRRQTQLMELLITVGRS